MWNFTGISRFGAILTHIFRCEGPHMKHTVLVDGFMWGQYPVTFNLGFSSQKVKNSRFFLDIFSHFWLFFDIYSLKEGKKIQRRLHLGRLYEVYGMSYDIIYFPNFESMQNCNFLCVHDIYNFKTRFCRLMDKGGKKT